jgi:DNA-binding NarL/FixJ family response regulator
MLQGISPRRVAIADDNPAFLEAAAAFVAGLPGYALAGTSDAAAQAIALVEKVLPDVLLLDLGLPASRGLEMVRRVKSLPGAPLVVALTMFHSVDAAQAAQGAGADALVAKESFVSGLNIALSSLYPG